MNTIDSLMRLAAVIESRKITHGGNPDTSYVARLLHKGPDAFLKKIGEEATETVMAAKDLTHGGDPQQLVNEMADLWFHCMVALAHYNWGAWKKNLCAKPCNETQEKTDVRRTRSRLHFLQNHPRQDSFTQGV
jgi:phosphoribosyl-ATP pyrophosphohydrolase